MVFETVMASIFMSLSRGLSRPVSPASVPWWCCVGQKLQKAGVILDIVPIHHQQTLDQLGKSWYSGTQVWGQPLGKEGHTHT